MQDFAILIKIGGAIMIRQKVSHSLLRLFGARSASSLMASPPEKKKTREDGEEEEDPGRCGAIFRYVVRYFSTNTTEIESARSPREYWERLPLSEKREQYKCGSNYLTLADIPTWQACSRKTKAQSPKEEEEEYQHNSMFNSKISLWRGDITRLEIDAIVNAANSSLLGGGGVDGAIHSAAGPSLRQECETLGGCDTGDAKITSGHRLPAKYIIHTVGPIYGFSSSLESCSHQLTSCYERSMQLALENNIRSIAFPCISTGVYGFPNYEATRIALGTIRKWLSHRNNSNKMDRVIFCVFLQKDHELYGSLLHTYFPLEPSYYLRGEEREEGEEEEEDTDSKHALPTLQKSISEPAAMPSHRHQPGERGIQLPHASKELQTEVPMNKIEVGMGQEEEEVKEEEEEEEGAHQQSTSAEEKEQQQQEEGKGKEEGKDQ